MLEAWWGSRLWISLVLLTLSCYQCSGVRWREQKEIKTWWHEPFSLTDNSIWCGDLQDWRPPPQDIMLSSQSSLRNLYTSDFRYSKGTAIVGWFWVGSIIQSSVGSGFHWLFLHSFALNKGHSIIKKYFQKESLSSWGARMVNSPCCGIHSVSYLPSFCHLKKAFFNTVPTVFGRNQSDDTLTQMYLCWTPTDVAAESRHSLKTKNWKTFLHPSV